MDEIDRIRARYAARDLNDAIARYAIFRRDAFFNLQALDYSTLRLMEHHGFTDLKSLTLLEIGCGTGGNLLRMLRWGFQPHHIIGNDLLPERCAIARSRLPETLRLIDGDARDLPSRQFDLVYQSTVLSSILDPAIQQQVADKAWSMVRPGGALFSYDLIFNNPKNPGVRKLTRKRLSELFPTGTMVGHRVTLAPPIARRIGDRPCLYRCLHAISPLRSHWVCLILKSAD